MLLLFLCANAKNCLGWAKVGVLISLLLLDQRLKCVVVYLLIQQLASVLTDDIRSLLLFGEKDFIEPLFGLL